jgi:hypothetical protein
VRVFCHDGTSREAVVEAANSKITAEAAATDTNGAWFITVSSSYRATHDVAKAFHLQLQVTHEDRLGSRIPT